MMYSRPGGKSPHTRGLQITVVVPAATTIAPINTGDVLTLTTAGAYTAQKAVADAVVQLKALHPVSDPNIPLGVQVYGFSRIDKFVYTGTLAIGDSIVADGTGAVKKVVTANGTFTCFVDTTNKIAEVLLP